MDLTNVKYYGKINADGTVSGIKKIKILPLKEKTANLFTLDKVNMIGFNLSKKVFFGKIKIGDKFKFLLTSGEEHEIEKYIFQIVDIINSTESPALHVSAVMVGELE